MFTVTVTPRFGEIDGFRHVNNTVVPHWFELGRTPIYVPFQPDLDFGNWPLILAHLDVDFHAPMVFGHDVEIRTYIARLGNSSITAYQEAWQQGVMCASGEAVVVHYDFEAKKSLPIPEDIRGMFMEHMRPA